MVIPTHETRRESRRARRGRHKGEHDHDDFQRGFDALGRLALDGVVVSACAVDLGTGRTLFAVDDSVSMPTASVGTIVLLIEVAARLATDPQENLRLVDRTAADAVTGTGIWQHLQIPSMPIADLAALVGATSDNLATNVLLRRVGLDAVRERAEALGLSRTALLDVVRDERGPDDAPQLSIGSARELTWLLATLANGEIVDSAVSSRVIGWLSLNTDLSMVASAFGLDVLSHRQPDHGVLLVNRTGTDVGVRAEVGVLRGPRAGVSYAVITQFDDTTLQYRLAVLEGMRTLGVDLLEYVH
ncbi:serine hydrolase [Rathayibacter sp. VKM Ac-2760]|uniref:serine hydrolase n=1 Tax=Rathayibacter sp. VKM Ac-2760 TaxID=2609253 RepID=UPI001315BD28|nr:serine hydrolase [Rathayibacter sp. VKM Ac-2760]QHC57226.1 serine hydrolase [Rathayibacter sp. VKM Ac-2760]